MQVESAHAVDGVEVARVRMTLTQPMRPRVRSSRNVIYVEADRLERGAGDAGMISTAGPATAIRDVRVTRRGDATAVTLLGTGRLVATSVEETEGRRAALVIDLPNVTSALPATTPIGQGPVESVRIGLNPQSPLVTQVVDGPDARVAVSPRVVAGRQRPDGRLRRAGRRIRWRRSRASAGSRRRGVRRLPPAQSAAPRRAAAPHGRAGRRAAAGAGAARCRQRRREYTGHPVSLDFQGADLRAVLRTFAEISGLNIVIDPTIQGTVDVALRDVPWDQALDIILRANKLGYVVDGTIVRIAPLTVLADEEAQRQKLAEEQALAGELRMLTRTLSYARAEDLAPLLTATVLSQRGSIQTDARTNTLIITDLPERLTRAGDLITTLDRAAAAGRDRGAHRPDDARVRAAARRAVGLQRPRDARRSATRCRWRSRIRAASAAGTRDLQPADAPTRRPRRQRARRSAIGLALGAVNGALNLDVALSALERQGRDASSRRRACRRRTTSRPRSRRAPDSDSDRREQHGDRDVQGRGADAEGDAADHRGQHRDHADLGRERVARLQPLRSTTSRRSTRSARSRRCSSATARRRSSAAST